MHDALRDMLKNYSIDWEPVGRRSSARANETLLEAAQSGGVGLASVCGGMGICYGCKIRIVKGEVTPLTADEQADFTQAELEAGYRLACRCRPLSDCRIEIPPESLTAPQRLQLEAQAAGVPVDPLVIPVDLSIDAPNLRDLRSDVTRLQDAAVLQGLPTVEVNFPLLENLSTSLRDLKWTARLALRGAEAVSALPAGRPLYGLAVDVGTTKLAAFLVNLETGRTAAQVGAMNPQISYGEDVVSRIQYAGHRPDGRLTLQSRLVRALNEMLASLREQAGAEIDQVVEAVVVGNTAMHHLFAGLPVVQLGVAPYVPAVSAPLEMRARDLGLELAPGAYVYLPSNIAGYVGADHISFLLACSPLQLPGTTIALDIGTNTEISLIRDGRIWSCSCASGPAFEGAHIRDGMRAAPGAIERVQWVDGRLLWQTIGGRPPVGICGSGILDAVASLLNAGAVNSRGNLLADHPLVSSVDGQRQVILAPAAASGHGKDVIISRQDISEIQLAKGAIRSGMEVLLHRAGLTASEVDRIIVAGAFGTYLDLASAVRAGMFPDLPLERFSQVGNAAGAGARQMLVSKACRLQAEALAARVEYIELTIYPEFTHEFTRQIQFD